MLQFQDRRVIVRLGNRRVRVSDFPFKSCVAQLSVDIDLLLTTLPGRMNAVLCG